MDCRRSSQASPARKHFAAAERRRRNCRAASARNMKRASAARTSGSLIGLGIERPEIVADASGLGSSRLTVWSSKAWAHHGCGPVPETGWHRSGEQGGAGWSFPNRCDRRWRCARGPITLSALQVADDGQCLGQRTARQAVGLSAPCDRRADRWAARSTDRGVKISTRARACGSWLLRRHRCVGGCDRRTPSPPEFSRISPSCRPGGFSGDRRLRAALRCAGGVLFGLASRRPALECLRSISVTLPLGAGRVRVRARRTPARPPCARAVVVPVAAIGSGAQRGQFDNGIHFAQQSAVVADHDGRATPLMQ